MTFLAKRHFLRNKTKFVIGGLLILEPTSRILFYGPSVFFKERKMWRWFAFAIVTLAVVAPELSVDKTNIECSVGQKNEVKQKQH